MKHGAKPKNFPARINARRLAALKRIEAQLASGEKRRKRTHDFHRRMDELTVEDRKRLSREADALALSIRPHDVVRAIRTKKDRSGTGRLSRA